MFRIVRIKKGLKKWARTDGISTRGLAFNTRKGRTFRRLAAAFNVAHGLAPNEGRLNHKTLAALAPYLPPRYADHGPVALAAGHIRGWNGAPLVNDGDEGRFAIRFTDAIAKELRARGLTVYLVPNGLDLGPEMTWIDGHVPARSRCYEWHLNAGGGAMRGFLACFSPFSSLSLRWARLLVKAVRRRKVLPIYGGGLIKSTTIAGWHGWSDIGWTRHLRASGYVPVLVELAYMTNKADAVVLNSKTGFESLVQACADGIAPEI